MTMLSRPFTVLSAVMARCLALLDARPWLLPLLFGLLSLLLGQDDNWVLWHLPLYESG